MTVFGQLPQSTALEEAQVDSLGELMSRDPEGYTRQDRDRIVATLRANRERLAAAEAAGLPKRSAGQVKISAPVVASAEDIGL